MKQLIRVMKALSDPSRVRIMKVLEKREMCVCEICAALGLPQPTVSNHLKILEGAELVTSRKDGVWVNYRLEENPGSRYAADMQAQLVTWLKGDSQLTAVLARLPEINRLDLTKKTEGPRS